MKAAGAEPLVCLQHKQERMEAKWPKDTKKEKTKKRTEKQPFALWIINTSLTFRSEQATQTQA